MRGAAEWQTHVPACYAAIVKRLLTHVVLFVAVLMLLATCLDWAVTSGLRRSEWLEVSEWNDIISGAAESDLIIQGSSRAWVHFSPSIIGSRLNMTCYNLGIDGYPLEMQLVRYSLYRKYAQKPKVIVQALDVFSLEERDEIYHARQFLPYFDEEIIRRGMQRYDYFRWYDYHLPLLRFRGEPTTLARGGLEFLGIRHYGNDKDRGYKGMTAEWSNEFAEFVRENPEGVTRGISRANVDALDSFLGLCKGEGVVVVLVYPPEYHEAQKVVNNREQVLAIYRSLARKHGLAFLDYSRDPIGYDTRYFYNSQHMNREGAELFSTQFAETLADIVRGTPTAAGTPAG